MDPEKQSVKDAFFTDMDSATSVCGDIEASTWSNLHVRDSLLANHGLPGRQTKLVSPVSFSPSKGHGTAIFMGNGRVNNS
jgi:hypothetical protein